MQSWRNPEGCLEEFPCHFPCHFPCFFPLLQQNQEDFAAASKRHPILYRDPCTFFKSKCKTCKIAVIIRAVDQLVGVSNILQAPPPQLQSQVIFTSCLLLLENSGMVKNQLLLQQTLQAHQWRYPFSEE